MPLLVFLPRPAKPARTRVLGRVYQGEAACGGTADTVALRDVQGQERGAESMFSEFRHMLLGQ
jgi:hypothetical protein